MTQFATLADKHAIETAMPWSERMTAHSMYDLISQTAGKFPDRRALSFQLRSGPNDPADTYTWAEFRENVTRAANVFNGLGIGSTDVVAYLLPNCSEAVFTLLGAQVAGVANPINPLLEPEQMAAILRETKAKVLVTLKSFTKTDVAQKAAEAVALAPNVETVIEVDLLRYLSPPTSWIAALIRPKNPVTHRAKVLDFAAEMAKARGDGLDFEDATEDRVVATFHTGGTTGMPKVVQHKFSGNFYNGWCATELIFTERDVLMCPLPMFHVFAAVAVLMPHLTSGAHLVLPTPQGYRGDGVFDNFWKLIERYNATFMITVPTAASALMQRKVDADVSTLEFALCGSAPLPVELFKKFEAATGVRILEGYGMSEATCLISINPAHGDRKIGSVGFPFPYTEVKILHCDAEGNVTKECGVDEVGEICVLNPGVYVGHTYTDPTKNAGLFTPEGFMRTGDLGRIDGEGFLWITGRAKDLIIRGGHNIDPAEIEEALAGHPAVAFVGAIGQPDGHSGELPCAYVELCEGAEVSEADLLAFAAEHVQERAALPKHLEILPELPKTAVGKIFKPDLRKLAITRVYDAALKAAGLEAHVAEVAEDKKRGLVARIVAEDQAITDEAVTAALGSFARPWEWKG